MSPSTSPPDSIEEQLRLLYGTNNAPELCERLQDIVADFQVRTHNLTASSIQRVTECDAILITYGDMVQQSRLSPLRALANFCCNHLAGAVSVIHILPFFPYSSDDGFSVIDYESVNPKLGTWSDVTHFGRHFRLMFDAVINHISSKSTWFRGFLRNDEHYRDYFITVDPGTNLSQVFRPRSLPLLTRVHTSNGPKLVWTTFSEDQIDLNYANPELLFKIVQTLLHYVTHGAEFIRLDAIAFLWKKIGTASINMPQTHCLIQIFRSVLDQIAPHVSLVTETNMAHEDNISYFGNGSNEAQLVYNFSLPPLVLHTFHTEDARALSRWAETLTLPSNEVTFLNFLASHDGIGISPARGILTESEIDDMAQRTQALGGNVSTQRNPDGSESIYELNINYLDALGNPNERGEDLQFVAHRFLASQAIMLALRGVPGIYLHSLLGSRGWRNGVAHTGHYRAINREKLERKTLDAELSDANSLRHKVFYHYLKLIKLRTASDKRAFHPNGGQQILFCNDAVFTLLRSAPDGEDHIFCIHNVSAQNQVIAIQHELFSSLAQGSLTDALTDQPYHLKNGTLALTLAPYQVIWLCSPSPNPCIPW